MRLRRKNKGFTIIELMVVVAIIAILAGIIIGNTGEQAHKAYVEETAGAIRDYLIEVSAVSAKTIRNVTVTNDTGKREIIANISNFESGGSHFVAYSKVDAVSMFSGANLFTTQNDGSSVFSPGGATTSFIIRPKGSATVGNAHWRIYIRVTKGKYDSIIEYVSNGNVNMYNRHRKGNETVDSNSNNNSHYNAGK
ncbi:prepilin-type N-terminal cleavage/methylation domain-containing protein [bacterium]|nr:prepilin-type N-terminal cleavage/methylation domain-containing protein [bacterium]